VTKTPVTWHREFTGDMAGLVEACGWIEELSSSNGLSDDISNAIQVCFEELASNVVRHSGGGLWHDPSGSSYPTSIAMKVDLTIEPHVVKLRLEDNGKAFDVAATESHGVDKPLSEMAVGGLGLHLVKTLASGLSYRRTSFGNETSLEFARVPMQEPTEP
jgi:anti-sigma regulatory factor (Ser/Thr protein kinase)